MANFSSVSRTATGRIRPATLISRLVHAPGVLPDTSLAPLVLLLDAEPYQVDLLEAVAGLPREVYLLDLPPRQQLSRLRSVPALAGVLRAAVRSKLPRGPYVLAGSGAAGVVMHEVAVQLQSAGEQVRHRTQLPSLSAAATTVCLPNPPPPPFCPLTDCASYVCTRHASASQCSVCVSQYLIKQPCNQQHHHSGCLQASWSCIILSCPPDPTQPNPTWPCLRCQQCCCWRMQHWPRQTT
jgi:hypothetical protein